jgi:hypothetical protein
MKRAFNISLGIFIAFLVLWISGVMARNGFMDSVLNSKDSSIVVIKAVINAVEYMEAADSYVAILSGFCSLITLFLSRI